MNFFGSDEFLDVAARVYFPHRRTSVELVRVNDVVLRLLVVEERRPVARLPFLDYHEPFDAPADVACTHRLAYIENVVHEIVDRDDWSVMPRTRGVEPAPFVDWGRFATYDDYMELLRRRSNRFVNDSERRRRRLAEHLGELTFEMNDRRADVVPEALRWKSAQYRETGERDLFSTASNVEFFEVLREHGLLTTSTLRADSRLLAVWLGFVHDRRWSGWIFTHDRNPELQKYSIGRQLLMSMLRESHAQGHLEFDFSIGDEQYKWFFATHTRVLRSVGRRPRHLDAADAARSCARRWISRSPRALTAARSLRSWLRNAGRSSQIRDSRE